MYRLFKFKNNVQPLQNLFFHSNGTQNRCDVNQRVCSLCNKLHNLPNVFSRHQSTSTNPYVKNKRLRKKRRNKTYSDVLVVTNKAMVHETARVHKLSPGDLKVFAATNLNLNELYKLKDVKRLMYIEEHTYNNLTSFVPEVAIDTFITNEAQSVTPQKVLCTSNSISPGSARPGFVTGNKGILTSAKESLRQDQSDTDGIAEFAGEYSVDTLFSTGKSTLPGSSGLGLVTGYKGILSSAKESLRQDQSDTDGIAEFAEEHRVDVLSRAKPIFHPETLEEEDATEQEAETTQFQPAELDKTAREEVVSQTLASYIEVCSYLNTPQRGLNALIFHRLQANCHFRKKFPVIKNVNVYNSIMKGFAAKGNFFKIQEVLQYAKDDKVVLNVQSYAIIFECLGRCNIKDNHLKQIRIHSSEALRNGITFDRIMNEAVFLSDQREMAIKAMKSYNPGYVLSFTKPNLHYTNHLVNSLNDDKQLELPALENKFVKKNNMQELIKKQLEFEKCGSVTIKSIKTQPTPTAEILEYRSIFEDHIQQWEKNALQGFIRDLQTLTARRGVLTIEPYLRLLSIKDFVQILVDEAKKIAQGSETFSPTCSMLYRQLGNKVYVRYKVLRKQKLAVLDKIVDIHSEYCAQYADLPRNMNTNLDYLNTRQRWQWIEHAQKENGATIVTDHQPWVPTVIHDIGKFLYQIIMHDLKIDVNAMHTSIKHKNFLPAFYTIFRTENHVMKEEVKPHPILSKLYRASAPETLTFPVSEMPMLCPPIPWSSPTTGGYLVAPCEMVRLPYQATTQKQCIKQTSPNALYPSLDSLNQLSAVPWKVNTKILDVILEVFNAGGSARLHVPEPSSSLQAPPPITPDMNKSQRYQIFRQKMHHKREKAEMYSLWCDCLYRLSLANHFRDDVFWLPHNMDFRGRVYPIPPHLNHLGADLARSMLVFAEAKPLGPTGLDWLKLHVVNLTGLKKRDSLSDRLIYANELMDKILDSADYPLAGKQWWVESDEPWQTLACCMEIAAAHRSDNPEEYLTNFPVHQDGSCNGLQHYAALGRDTAGAKSVNLAKSQKPQDVYTSVVLLVEEQRQKDAALGMTVAKLLEGFVKRKVIKQTIMTTVYGVTRFGARLQIARQLKDIENFPKEHIFSASNYLTSRTFESLRSMFTSTREIQDWFTECARVISSVACRNVEWITPLGFPIVQPYTRYRKFGKGIVYESFVMDQFEKPNVMKQKNAFPPNFIHSLDSSHMMLTSLFCERAGIKFVSVHDCYWTHPSTVSIMNKICREQFVALHSEPILKNLSCFLSEKFGNLAEGVDCNWTKRRLNRILCKWPETSDFDIREVLKSVYFFS